MQPKKPYFEVTLLGNPKKRKLWIIIISIMLVIIILSVIIVALVRTFSKNALSPQTYYYVYVSTDAENATDAETAANEYRVRGGAGLTYHKDNKWYIILSLYLSENDAKKVCAQLSEQDIVAEYANITTTPLANTAFTDEERKIAENIYDHYKQTIEAIYQISIDLDSSTITESSAQVRVSQLALLWSQRTMTLADKIDLTRPESKDHPLLDTYTLSMQVTGLLDVLADESNYSATLLTYTSLARRTTFSLASIEI